MVSCFQSTCLLILVAPTHARINREWGYFVAGKLYNITCNVMGSEPSPYIKILLNHKSLKKMNVSYILFKY